MLDHEGLRFVCSVRPSMMKNLAGPASLVTAICEAPGTMYLENLTAMMKGVSQGVYGKPQGKGMNDTDSDI